jgi:hypothetical protein
MLVEMLWLLWLLPEWDDLEGKSMLAIPSPDAAEPAESLSLYLSSDDVVLDIAGDWEFKTMPGSRSA